MQTSDGHRISLSTEKGVTWFAMGGPHMILKARITMPELESLIVGLGRELRAWQAREAVNPYTVLGVARTATTAEIRKAYRTLQKQFHPDSEGGNTEKSQTINAAYETLSDAARRREYDATLSNQ